MPWFDADSPQAQAYNHVTDPKQHKASLTHELLAGGAAFEAAKAIQNHQIKNGRIPTHEKAKEFLAGAVGAFVDHMVETKGLDAWDREKTKRIAQPQAEEALGQPGGY